MPLSIGKRPFFKESSKEELISAIQALFAPLPTEQTLAVEPEADLLGLQEDDYLTPSGGSPVSSVSTPTSHPASAYWVNRKSVIFSSDRLIATTTAPEGITLIIQHHVNKKTALVHIDYSNTDISIKHLLNLLPEGKKQVVLVSMNRACVECNEASENLYNKVLAILLEEQDQIEIDRFYIVDTAHFISVDDKFFQPDGDFKTFDIAVDPRTLTITSCFTKVLPPCAGELFCHDIDIELNHHTPFYKLAMHNLRWSRHKEPLLPIAQKLSGASLESNQALTVIQALSITPISEGENSFPHLKNSSSPTPILKFSTFPQR